MPKKKKPVKKKSKRRMICVALIALFLFSCAFIVWDQGNLTVTQYQFASNKLDTPVRIVQLCDLHNKEFGKNNIRLVEKIRALTPDLIAITGDMNSDDPNAEQVVLPLLERLTQIAPVYYALGNHEYRLAEEMDTFVEKIKQTGTIFLENEMVTYTAGGKTITIGGMSNYPFYEGYAPDYDNDARHFLDDFSAKKDFKLLLCHFPEHYIWRYNEYDIDLMLAGHTHGGVLQVPFLGGVVAPNQPGLFPEYCDGLHTADTSSILISKGLGSNFWWLPRVNNPGEITVVNLGPEE